MKKSKMDKRPMRYLTLPSVLLLVTIILFQQVCSSCLERKQKGSTQKRKLSDIISFAKANPDRLNDACVLSETFNTFDFSKMNGSVGKTGLVDSVRVCFDQEKKVNLINTFSSLEDNNFKFRVVPEAEANYVILLPTQIYDTDFENEQNAPVGGFFINFNERVLFVAYGAKCIMDVDSNLRVIKTLRFRMGELVEKTIVNYVDGGRLDSERIYRAKSTLRLDKDTTLDQVISLFDNTSDFEFRETLKIGLLEKLSHLPLWTYGGEHEYDYSKRQ